MENIYQKYLINEVKNNNTSYQNTKNIGKKYIELINSPINIRNHNRNNENKNNESNINNIKITASEFNISNNSFKKKNTSPSFYKFQKYFYLPSKEENNYSYIKSTMNNNFQNNKMNKNESLKSQIELAQKNISEQFSEIIKNYDNNDKINHNKIKDLEEKYEKKIEKMIQNKDEEIRNLENELRKGIETHEKLISEMNNSNEDGNLKLIEYKNIINELQYRLVQKEEELLYLKETTEKKEINKNIDLEHEKNMISNDYEKKIHNILNITENEQQKLLNIIKEKNIIIQNLINCNDYKDKIFDSFIEKIRNENNNLENFSEKSIGISKSNILN